jgi:hypothetical protein
MERTADIWENWDGNIALNPSQSNFFDSSNAVLGMAFTTPLEKEIAFCTAQDDFCTAKQTKQK